MFHAVRIEKLQPSVWWSSIKRMCKTGSRGLCDLTITLVSASVEKIDSGAIHIKLCNRLGTQKAAKLVACYEELRGAIDLDWLLCYDILYYKQ